MSRPFKLNFQNYYDFQRVEEVRTICATTPYLTDSDLEVLANHIIYGKDKSHLSPIDKKNVAKTNKPQETSYEALLEGPTGAYDLELPQERSRFKKLKPRIDRTADANIPGMAELWETIARLEQKLPTLPDDIAYKYRQWIKDLRLDQYYLKEIHRPAIHFTHPTKPGPARILLDCDTGLWLEPEDWAARKRNPHPRDPQQPPYEQAEQNSRGQLYWKISDNNINVENPKHIYKLLQNYVSLLKHTYDRPDSDTRALLWDLERYIEMAELSDLEQFLLECLVGHKNRQWVSDFLQSEEGIMLSVASIANYQTKTIPRKIATAAIRHHLECDLQNGKVLTKKCTKCGKELPLHTLYYARSREKISGFCSQCKKCQKEGREARKQQQQ